VHPHRFRHHFSHTWLDRGGPEGDLMELNGWASPQMWLHAQSILGPARRGYFLARSSGRNSRWAGGAMRW
jgi:integrase